jgi:hypothetical protein
MREDGLLICCSWWWLWLYDLMKSYSREERMCYVLLKTCGMDEECEYRFCIRDEKTLASIAATVRVA